jgi:hemolysin-activating ACP:hemolysin acyltransferase
MSQPDEPDIGTAPDTPRPNGADAPSDGQRTTPPRLAGRRPTSADDQERLAALQASASFGQVVSVLMRSSEHKHLTLTDLEWLVVPPLTAGQFAIANMQSKEGGAIVPAAVVLWASVSSEVDQRLSANLSEQLRLRPDEWKSGDILWLIEAVGDGRLLSNFLKNLQEKAFKSREVRVRLRRDGEPVVSTLNEMFRLPHPPSDEKLSF